MNFVSRSPVLRKRLKMVFVAAASLVGLVSMWALWWEPASLRVLEDCVAVKWPHARSLRVAVLTDLHVGSPFNGVDKLREIVRHTNTAAPDAILKSVGIVDLEDRAVNVETPAGIISVAGVSDMWTRPHDVRAAIASVPDMQLPLLVLTHNPDVFPEIPPSVTITLAGHTHGGQVRLPLLGAPLVPSRYGQRFAAGHIVEDGRHLYVATGTGTSILPVRFGVPPAIVVLTIGRTCTP
jgi:uncharacterized protein